MEQTCFDSQLVQAVFCAPKRLRQICDLKNVLFSGKQITFNGVNKPKREAEYTCVQCRG
jgi:hypothetical protein